MNRTLAFDEPNHLRNWVLGRYRDHHVNMIWRQVALFYAVAFLLRQTSKHLTQVLAQFRIQHLSPILRYKDDVVLAVPFCVVQTFHFVHPVSPFVCLAAHD